MMSSSNQGQPFIPMFKAVREFDVLFLFAYVVTDSLITLPSANPIRKTPTVRSKLSN